MVASLTLTLTLTLTLSLSHSLTLSLSHSLTLSPSHPLTLSPSHSLSLSLTLSHSLSLSLTLSHSLSLSYSYSYPYPYPFLQVKLSRREKAISSVSRGTCEMLRGRSAGLPLTLNVPPCPKKMKKCTKAKSASLTEAAKEFNSTVIGGSTTILLADLIMNSIKCRRFRISEALVQSESAPHIPLHTAISKKMSSCSFFPS